MTTTVEAPRAEAGTTCSSCGYEFGQEEGHIACGTCVSKGGCGMVKCPKCGLEQARTPAFLERLLGFFRRSTPNGAAAGEAGAIPAGSLLLSGLQAGETAVVEKFLDTANVRKFLSLGILPGTQLTVIRNSPVVVLRVGYSEFAFDRALASTLQVQRTKVSC